MATSYVGDGQSPLRRLIVQRGFRIRSTCSLGLYFRLLHRLGHRVTTSLSELRVIESRETYLQDADSRWYVTPASVHGSSLQVIPELLS